MPVVVEVIDHVGNPQETRAKEGEPHSDTVVNVKFAATPAKRCEEPAIVDERGGDLSQNDKRGIHDELAAIHAKGEREDAD